MGSFRLQVFTSIQEKAIEAEMVATKDVCMEPTIRSLQEDLVSGLTHQHQDINELLFPTLLEIFCSSSLNSAIL